MAATEMQDKYRNGMDCLAVDNTPTSSGGANSFSQLSGRFTWAQAPAVSATDNGKFLGVTGGSLQLYEPVLSGFGSGSLPTSRLSGNLSALRINFTGLTTNQQNAIKSALNITSGSAATIMFGSVGPPELDLYTSGSTASTFTYDQTKREEFIRALGLTRDAGYTRYSGDVDSGGHRRRRHRILRVQPNGRRLDGHPQSGGGGQPGAD